MAEQFDVYLDDVRATPFGWKRCYVIDEVKQLLEAGVVRKLSLDHDLGACEACMKQWHDDIMNTDDKRVWAQEMPNCSHFGTGYDLVCWMEENNMWPPDKPRVHSANPTGAARMRQVIDKHYGPYQDSGSQEPQNVAK